MNDGHMAPSRIPRHRERERGQEGGWGGVRGWATLSAVPSLGR